jgi:HAD superfamily hydrolase (TIGR01509 family)
VSGRAVQAVVFDLDGVLVDSEPIYLELTRRLVAPAEVSDEDYARFIGTHGMARWISESYGIPLDDVVPRMRQLQRTYLAETPPPAVDGAHELIEAIQGRDLRLGVASQSGCSWVEAMLDRTGLAEAFDTLVSAQEVEHGKPEPDVYLRAAELLGADPAACIAVEDSAHGVTAASAAGMIVVQTRQTSHPFPPQPGAAVVVDSLRDFDLDWLDGGRLDRVPAPR